MDFKLSKEQKILKDSARKFLNGECPSEFVREMGEDEKGYTTKMWDELANLGWLALILPEQYNGLGYGLFDLVLMMEEVGRACMPGPFLSTVLGSIAILESNNDAQKATYLPNLANGNLIFALAFNEPGNSRYEPKHVATRATQKKHRFVLQGTKLFVSDAHVADYIVCPARSEGEILSTKGISLFMVPRQAEGLELRPLKTIESGKQFEVVLNSVSVPEKNLLGNVGQGWSILEHVLNVGAIAKCAEMVGGAQKVLEMSVEYAKQRVQFGKPIGSFQAIQHHCANMFLDVEGSRYLTYKAASLLDIDHSNHLIPIAKGWISDAYQRIITLGHQIGGGSAIMRDHDMTLYSCRAKAAEIAFGDAGYHRRIVALSLGL